MIIPKRPIFSKATVFRRLTINPDGQPSGINASASDAQHGSGPQTGGLPDVPAASELFDGEAFRRLRDSRELAVFVEELRAREAQVAERTESITRDSLLRAYAGIIADDLSKVGLAVPVAAYSDAASLFEAVTSLPFSPRTAKVRRKAREVARVVMLSEKGELRVPVRVDEVSALWEQAMCGEPRWSADYPSSTFRTGGMVITGGGLEHKVLHRCIDPSEMPPWLERLIEMLADESLAPELRAACGLGLHDWIHPFVDGNGHTGRLLMLAVLSSRYTQPTLVCLSHELVMNRSATMRQFARLRGREADATGFCLGLLGQLKDAQERAMDVFAQ